MVVLRCGGVAVAVARAAEVGFWLVGKFGGWLCCGRRGGVALRWRGGGGEDGGCCWRWWGGGWSAASGCAVACAGYVALRWRDSGGGVVWRDGGWLVGRQVVAAFVFEVSVLGFRVHFPQWHTDS